MVARRWRVAAAVAAVAATALLWAGAHQPRAEPFMEPFSWQLGQAVLGGLAWTLSGVALWSRAPTRRLGTLLVLAGTGITVGRLIDSTVPVLFTLAVAVQFVGFTFVFWSLLGYPSGRLTARLDRVTVAAIAAVTVVYGVVSSTLFDPAFDWCASCPPGLNVLLLRHAPAVVHPSTWRSSAFSRCPARTLPSR